MRVQAVHFTATTTIRTFTEGKLSGLVLALLRKAFARRYPAAFKSVQQPGSLQAKYSFVSSRLPASIDDPSAKKPLTPFVTRSLSIKMKRKNETHDIRKTSIAVETANNQNTNTNIVAWRKEDMHPLLWRLLKQARPGFEP